MKRSLFARLEHQHAALDDLLAGLMETQIRQKPPSGKWSVYENIAHLGRYQQIFRERMEIIIVEESPGFDRYVAENDSGFSDWLNRSVDKLLRDYRKDREGILHFVSQLSANQMQRAGIHPVYGLMTMEGWAEFFLLHEAHHFFTIFKLEASFRN